MVFILVMSIKYYDALYTFRSFLLLTSVVSQIPLFSIEQFAKVLSSSVDGIFTLQIGMVSI